MVKKIIIFESVKGAGKTVLSSELGKCLKNSVVLDENITLKPIKHSANKKIDEDEYLKIIEEIRASEFDFYLVDRFHYTKWPCLNYDKEYFNKIECSLFNGFEVYFVFLKIREKCLLKRLNETYEYRRSSGWKLNYDGVSIEEEAGKDIKWQKFFLENQFKDSKVENKLVLDTSDLNKDIGNLDEYVQEILKFVS